MRWMNWIKLAVVLLMVGLVMGACSDRPEVETASAPDPVQPAEPLPSEAPAEATAASVELDRRLGASRSRTRPTAGTASS